MVINTAAGRRKTRNVRQRPGVGLSVTAVDDPYRWCSVTGRVVAVDRDGAEDHIHALAERYTGERYDLAGEDGERVRLLVEPSRVFTGG